MNGAPGQCVLYKNVTNASLNHRNIAVFRMYMRFRRNSSKSLNHRYPLMGAIYGSTCIIPWTRSTHGALSKRRDKEFLVQWSRGYKVRREGDGSIDEDMEPGVSIIADLSPTTRKHADTRGWKHKERDTLQVSRLRTGPQWPSDQRKLFHHWWWIWEHWTAGIIKCFSRVTCSDHKISTVLGTVLSKTTTMSNGIRSKPFYRYISDLPVILTLINDCKGLVQYFNQANLQKLLTKTLKSENDTRWSSLYDMLLNVKESFYQVTAVL
jgi:hypothetical protein